MRGGRSVCYFMLAMGATLRSDSVPPPKNDIKSTYFSRWRSRDLHLSFISFDVSSVFILHQWVKVKSEVETKLWTT